MILVVGSGPAGVACAEALLERGASVTMIDAGVEMEPELQAAVAALRAQPPEAWDASALARIRRPTEETDRAVPLKAAYGSLFPYRHAPRALTISRQGVDALPSFAQGGFSNVWGATVLPFHPRDMANWPLTPADLAPHYAAAARMMGVPAPPDRLEREFPLFGNGSAALNPSRQADALMADLDANAATLAAAGWSFGRARLAVQAGPTSDGHACVYCGLCLYGCPYGLIYSSRSTLDALRRHPRFTYHQHAVITRIEEGPDGVRLHGERHESPDRVTFAGDRVCLAGGVYNTTAMLLASLGAYDTPVRVLDSQIFLLPALRFQAVPGVVDEKLYTLSQIFIEVADPAVSAGTIHLQLYTYNDWYGDAARRRAGVLFPMLKPWLNAVLGRLIVIQGYLPSDVSGEITATLRKGASGDTLQLEGREKPSARAAVDRIIAAWRRHRRSVRAIPLSPLLELCAPGRGYHTGGSFPMRKAPGRLETDLWGRPHGLERVHAVDATIFPTVPAAPVTFTIAANARRIATEIPV